MVVRIGIAEVDVSTEEELGMVFRAANVLPQLQQVKFALPDAKGRDSALSVAATAAVAEMIARTGRNVESDALSPASERDLGVNTIWFLNRLLRFGKVTSAEFIDRTKAENPRSVGGLVNKIRNDLTNRGFVPEEVFTSHQVGESSEYRAAPRIEAAYTKLSGTTLPGMGVRPT